MEIFFQHSQERRNSKLLNYWDKFRIQDFIYEKKKLKLSLIKKGKIIRIQNRKIINLDLFNENEVKASSNSAGNIRLKKHRTLDGNPKFKGYKINPLFN